MTKGTWEISESFLDLICKYLPKKSIINDRALFNILKENKKYEDHITYGVIFND